MTEVVLAISPIVTGLGACARTKVLAATSVMANRRMNLRDMQCAPLACTSERCRGPVRTSIECATRVQSVHVSKQAESRGFCQRILLSSGAGPRHFGDDPKKRRRRRLRQQAHAPGVQLVDGPDQLD